MGKQKPNVFFVRFKKKNLYLQCINIFIVKNVLITIILLNERNEHKKQYFNRYDTGPSVLRLNLILNTLPRSF